MMAEIFSHSVVNYVLRPACCFSSVVSVVSIQNGLYVQLTSAVATGEAAVHGGSC